MRADDRIGLKAFEFTVQLARIQPFEPFSDRGNFRFIGGTIRVLIQVRPQQRHLFDELQVRIEIEFAETFRNEIEDVDMRHAQMREIA